jgi:integrase
MVKIMSPYKIQIVKFDDGERYPILLHSDTGMPLFMPTIYITTMRRSANRAFKSLEADLRAIMQLYTWASIEGVDIEEQFAQGQFFETSEIEAVVRAARMKYDELVELHEASQIKVSNPSVISYEKFRKLAPKKSSQVQGATGATRIRHIRDYIDWLAVMSISRISSKSDDFQNVEAARAHMKKGFTARLPKSKGRNQENNREGIEDKDVDYILSVLNPESPENPFTDYGARVRNQLIFLLLYMVGVRRGECLGIKIDDINFQDGTVLIRRRADDPDDLRKDRPNTKTKDRKLPLEGALLDMLQNWTCPEKVECVSLTYPARLSNLMGLRPFRYE